MLDDGEIEVHTQLIFDIPIDYSSYKNDFYWMILIPYRQYKLMTDLHKMINYKYDKKS